MTSQNLGVATEIGVKGTGDDKSKDSTCKPNGLPNPFFFPERFLDTGLRLHGIPVARLPVSRDPMTHLENIMALPMRPDDVVIAAFPKCGTHWTHDMLFMLTRGRVHYTEQTKASDMFEYVDDLTTLEDKQSPRILNSHLHMRLLPREIVEKRVKIIHLIRNPKDVAVSYFHHLKQYASQEFTFARFLQGYTTDNYMTSHQWTYLEQMAQFCTTHPDHPVLTIAYEELKKDTVAVLREMAKFLEIPCDEELFQEIVSACTIDKLKSQYATRKLPQNLQSSAPGGKKLEFYRKGIVGDWKNHFTVAQSEEFDEFIKHRMTECGSFASKWAQIVKC